MASFMSIIFKVATEPDEFEKIHRLNYQTFVEEIPQYEPNPQGMLVDKFHDENRTSSRWMGMNNVRVDRKTVYSHSTSASLLSRLLCHNSVFSCSYTLNTIGQTS